MTRILVTGGRQHPDPAAVNTVLDTHWPTPGGTLTVVHGACPTGADRWAREWCDHHADLAATQGARIVEERHPADWHIHGQAAGALRNAEMVRLGADLCESFPDSNSVDTYNTVDLARRAGIPTTVHRLPDDPPKRVRRSRATGSRLPAAAVSVTRPGRFGNRFIAGVPYEFDGYGVVRDNAHAVDLYRRWLPDQPELVLDVRRELQGRDLACWCAETDPCHATVLLRVAEGGIP